MSSSIERPHADVAVDKDGCISGINYLHVDVEGVSRKKQDDSCYLFVGLRFWEKL